MTEKRRGGLPSAINPPRPAAPCCRWSPAGIACGIAAVMGACLLLLAVRVLHEGDGRAARRMFRFSILSLFVLFAALIIERPLATAFAVPGLS